MKDFSWTGIREVYGFREDGKWYANDFDWRIKRCYKYRIGDENILISTLDMLIRMLIIIIFLTLFVLTFALIMVFSPLHF